MPQLIKRVGQTLVGLLFVTMSGALYAQPTVLIETSMGPIKLELNQEKAPKTVENFLSYVEEGHYNGTVFHRVINNFMIQGGGFNENHERKAMHAAIENEATNGLANDHGTIAMARTSDPHSATAQFFINLADNGFLNHTGKNPRGWGYAVFGKVVKGMDIVEAIGKVETGASAPFRSDVPKTAVVITNVTVLPD